MAGESPDRSKQHESSAEPTPGSAGTVPEPRDPRLAVSREKDSASAAVDTATKVLSIRDAKPAANSEDDDTALREAVSAWVRSADTPEDPEQEAESDQPETAEAEADTETEPETEAKAEPDAESAEDAEAKADAGSESAEDDDAEAKADAGSEPAKDASVGTKADAESDDDTEDEPKADAEPEEADADAKADTEVENADADAKADTEVENADADAEADAEDEAKPAAEDEAEVTDEKPQAAEEDSQTADDDPEAADGEDAPQGPPAADDETRTGGAGGNETADGEAEAKDADKDPQAPREAEAKGVDQPTTLIKAVRPKKPAVDQPTTTLKLGGSKFVPLKTDTTAPTTALPQVGPERTTQQPLPPKPPLDLLAELTNTPRPPETPVRTLVRRVKIWTPLVLLLAVIFAVVQAVRPLPQPTLDLTAKDTYTFEGGKADIPWPSTGQAALDVQGIGTFGSSGTQKPVPIASVAKVMTAYLILRDHPLKSGEAGPKITIDKPAEEQSDAGQESTVPVTAGDKISEREALEAILLPSANNVARLLARWDSSTEKAFVTKMNAAAKKLGMTNTTYTDPSGLTDSTVSTAVDQVKLAKAAMQQPAFREVAAMMSYDDYKGVNHSNYNRLVGHNNVVGIKTGTTTSALGNLVFAAKQEVGGETRTIIGAVMRQPAGGFDNTIISGVLDAGDKLIRSAQGALKSATILKKGDVVGYVDDGLGGRTPVVATKDVTAAGWAGLKVKLSFTSDVVPHTAKAGTKVGSLTVGDGSAGAVTVPVALQKALTEPGFTDKLTRLG
ncbi:D-alanyl-D-alanine carboxypeptidase [Streptomyces diastatochromogenes]|uniref:serine-type D-Ala-D-Ala carboxypeptidase n=1 Tax=Streptomyces diastatochromogenes TaxID=42236 RepID=A0A233SJA5_STRDA|nr:D-alanyl-D-alanine carboxypeptidase [Streptomyces diastatochromogenes]MCZ0988682.1 D-alanyl-D-alanine carboxypeptidase [Streptomyces diastatochromogenes]OXY95689.1 D-alanyl-D-alanine carboxypeptidase [Streptomyces diastatochromogenes]